ncbi:MAG: response regulator [Treponema sp.]|nr:response regulator [Treponema sp.]
MQKTVFVVDDNEINLTIANEVLKGQYRVMTMPSASKMFALIEKIVPDIILLDIEMPEMDGFGALNRLKSNAALADIPVIFLTAMTDSDVEARGFQLGVIDFITKPFSPPVLINRIMKHLDIDDIIRERTALLHQRTIQLQKLQNSMVFVIADMIENRDKGTGNHVERTTTYIRILIDAMISHNVYEKELSAMDIDLLCSSARLHDVGKVVIPDAVLNKPGKLTAEEYEIMKTHASEGERIIDQMASHAGSDTEFLTNAKLFAGYHHERWDGKGYPRGLDRLNIPLQGRIMAVVDVYDALVSRRPYKEPFTSEEAVKIIMDSSGEMFDPLIVEVFKEVKELFEAAVV